MNKTSISSLTALQIVAWLAAGWILYAASRDFHQIAWGTGVWLGEFSPTWLAIFAAFALFSALVWGTITAAIFRPAWTARPAARLVALRERLGVFRWLLVALVFLAPVTVLQGSPWGVVLSGLHLRMFIWLLAAGSVGVLITHSSEHLLTWPGFLSVLLAEGALFALTAPFAGVTDYPFSMGWSEGNRLWDYSLFFGRERYLYPADQPLSPFLDFGRELLGGLPFVYSGLSISGARLWLAFMVVFPYLVLGALLFGLPGRETWLGVLGSLWAFLFVEQGPIHPPLLLCAILVAVAWRRPLWLALPLIAFAGYFAELSRFTWMFAPAMWAGMLELSAARTEDGRLGRQDWVRAIAVALAGLLGGVLLPNLLNLVQQPDAGMSSPVAFISQAVSKQPLLWYRLLPNATFGPGILLGLLLAVGPLTVVLVYLSRTRRWTLNAWQGLALAAPLAAFLVVGLIVSTKIGGGGDLHNMDMFLLGAVFAAAVAWRNGGREWIRERGQFHLGMRGVLLLLVVLPSLGPLTSLRPIAFADSVDWVSTLTDNENPRSLGSLPSEEQVQDALSIIRREVDLAKAGGEVLFMDQRQLLTFGFVRNVPLVSEYEKKLLMDRALSENAVYFAPFYEDIRAQRFDLIVTEPLRAPIKDRDYQFGEENNAWVEWVVIPVLCYYEPKETMIDVRVQLLAPRQDVQDCSGAFPAEVAE